MSRRLKRIVKSFDFTADLRKQFTFSSDAIRIGDKGLQLTAVGGEYSTAVDLHAKTWVANPRSLKRWIGFQVDVKHYKGPDNLIATSVAYKLNDGASDLYWDGAAWSLAGTSDWNTEAEVANNIDQFPVDELKLQLIVNLATTWERVTPELIQARFLYESDLEEMEDYIWRSCLKDFNEKIRPIAEHAVQITASSNVIDLKSAMIETPYDLKSIDSVYDVTNDPNKFDDLFDSYDVSTKVITLTAPVAAGSVAFIRFTYAPVTAVSTSQDYTEIEKVPEILVEQIIKENDLGIFGIEYVINKSTGQGWKVPIRQADVTCVCQFITDKAKDYARLSDAIRRYFRQNDVITSRGTDEKYRLDFLGEQAQSLSLDQVELLTGRFRFRIVKAVFFDNDAVPVHGTMNFDLTLLKQ